MMALIHNRMAVILAPERYLLCLVRVRGMTASLCLSLEPLLREGFGNISDIFCIYNPR